MGVEHYILQMKTKAKVPDKSERIQIETTAQYHIQFKHQKLKYHGVRLKMPLRQAPVLE